MASIRTRITASYALAFAGTMFAFSAVVWAERRAVAFQDLRDSAANVTDLGIRMLRLTGVGSEAMTIDTTSAAGHMVGIYDVFGRIVSSGLPSVTITVTVSTSSTGTPFTRNTTSARTVS